MTIALSVKVLAYIDRLRRPETHDRIDTAAGEQTHGRVRLHTVDDVVVGVQDFHEVRAPPVPDEQVAVVRAGRDVLRARVRAQPPARPPGARRGPPPPPAALELVPTRKRRQVTQLQVAQKRGLMRIHIRMYWQYNLV